MIKKCTILTLILTLITTQSYGMVSFFRSVVENKTGVVEKFFKNLFSVSFLVISSTSHAPEEKKEISQKDVFVEYNKNLLESKFLLAEQTWRERFNYLSDEEIKKIPV